MQFVPISIELQGLDGPKEGAAVKGCTSSMPPPLK